MYIYTHLYTNSIYISNITHVNITNYLEISVRRLLGVSVAVW